MDQTFETATLTPLSAEAADRFNAISFCERTDHVEGVKVDVADCAIVGDGGLPATQYDRFVIDGDTLYLADERSDSPEARPEEVDCADGEQQERGPGAGVDVVRGGHPAGGAVGQCARERLRRSDGRGTSAAGRALAALGEAKRMARRRSIGAPGGLPDAGGTLGSQRSIDLLPKRSDQCVLFRSSRLAREATAGVRCASPRRTVPRRPRRGDRPRWPPGRRLAARRRARFGRPSR